MNFAGEKHDWGGKKGREVFSTSQRRVAGRDEGGRVELIDTRDERKQIFGRLRKSGKFRRARGGLRVRRGNKILWDPRLHFTGLRKTRAELFPAGRLRLTKSNDRRNGMRRHQ